MRQERLAVAPFAGPMPCLGEEVALLEQQLTRLMDENGTTPLGHSARGACRFAARLRKIARVGRDLG